MATKNVSRAGLLSLLGGTLVNILTQAGTLDWKHIAATALVVVGGMAAAFGRSLTAATEKSPQDSTDFTTR